MSTPVIPIGREAVIATFGDLRHYADDKRAWERQILVTRKFEPRNYLRYAYDTSATITRIRAHFLVADVLMKCLVDCQKAKVPLSKLKYGGCYVWRPIRGSTQLSLHSWGIAVDLEPAENPLGKEWVDDGVMLDPRIICIFKCNGWFWGGDFKTRPDAQHFQWARGT